jgi:hypothetical protein
MAMTRTTRAASRDIASNRAPQSWSRVSERRTPSRLRALSARLNQECLEAQYKVGYYYDHGIVVNVDKKERLICMKYLLKKGIVMLKKDLLIYMNKVKE